jgi:iron complex outermembrane receptor protein
MHFKPLRQLTALILCGTALAPLLATAALAQDANTTLLQPYTVQGNGSGTGPVNGIVPKATNSGAKTATPINEIPQSVSVIGRQQLDTIPGNAKVDEAMRYTAGVNGQTYGTDADTDWFYVRGFQAEQTGMYMDGLPLYQTGFGTWLVDPFLLERIEVLKGPSSSLYGGGNVGGIVNYVGKRPFDEPLRYTEVGVNNFGNGYFGFDLNDKLTEDGTILGRLVGKVSGGGWETANAKDFRGVIAPSVTFQPDASTTLTVHGSYQRLDLDHTSTGFLPYVGTAVDAPGGVRIPRNLNPGEPANDVYDRHQLMLGYEFEHIINDTWTVRQNARYSAVKLNEDWILPDGSLVGTTLGRYRFAHDTFAQSVSVDNQLEGHLETGPLTHNLLLGADYRYYNIDQTQASKWPGTGLDIFNPVYGLPIPVLNAPYIDNHISLNQLGLYAQDQIKFGDGFIATLNGRYDLLSTNVDNATGADQSRQEGAFSGRVALGYEFDNGLTPYISYGTSFSPSLATGATGELLQPETGQQIEAGIKYEPTFFNGLITASVFDIRRHNVTAQSPAFINYAIGTVETRGLEVEAQANVTDDLKVIGAVTWLDAEVTEALADVPLGNSPTLIPKLTASLWVEYSFPQFDGFSIGGGIRHLGESFADNANTLTVPSATLFDAALNYEKDDWGISLKASNLFDTAYVAGCKSAVSCGYGAGRTITLTAHKKW